MTFEDESANWIGALGAILPIKLGCSLCPSRTFASAFTAVPGSLGLMPLLVLSHVEFVITPVPKTVLVT